MKNNEMWTKPENLHLHVAIIADEVELVAIRLNENFKRWAKERPTGNEATATIGDVAKHLLRICDDLREAENEVKALVEEQDGEQ